jgi:thymidylate synthase (FAD)
MNNEIICLPPHGYVRLVDSMGADLSIVRAARVSHNADWRAGQNEGSDERLIRYLWEHAHTSPFEAVVATFEVQAPIFVFREWHRHRTQSYSEISARYTELPELFYIPDPARVGIQNTKNKQGTTDTDDPAVLERRIVENEELVEHCKAAFALYHKFLASGQPRECARFCLPVNTFSRMFASANLLNWFRFLTLRTAPAAQYEIRAYANAVIQLLEQVAPVAVAAYDEARTEVK